MQLPGLPWVLGVALPFVAACGSGSSSDMDVDVDVDATAIDPDGSLDATPASGPATITVVRTVRDVNPGAVMPDVPVYFIRPDRTFEMKLTGNDGKATAEVVPGSTILAAHHRLLLEHDLTAFVGVGPGFDVIAGDHPWPSSAGRVTFTIAPVANAVGYNLLATCTEFYDAGTLSVTLDVDSACPTATAATVVATAIGPLGDVFAHSVDTNVDLIASRGQTRTMPPFVSSSAVLRATYTNFPTDDFYSVDTRLELQIGGEAVLHADVYGTVSDQTRETGTLQVHRGVAPVGTSTWIRSSFSQIWGAVSHPDPDQNPPVYHVRRHASRELTHSLDVGANILPRITFPALDLPSRKLAWTLSGGGPGRQADAVIAKLGWTGANGAKVHLTLVAPGEGDDLSLPPLPSALAELTPSVADEGRVDEFWMIDLVGKGYQELATDIIPESIELRQRFQVPFNSAAFADEQELWYTGSRPM